jgi:hypothetical protein
MSMCRSRSHLGAIAAVAVGLVALPAIGLPIGSASAATDTWTGGGSTANWSSTTNWSGGVPGATDTVVFSLPVVTGLPNNDLVGASVSAIDVAGGHQLTGNALGLAAGLTARPGAAPSDGVALALPVSVTASQTWTVQQGAILQVDGAVALGSSTLTVGGAGTAGFHGQLSGTGGVVVDGAFTTIDGPVSLTGPMTLASGVLNVASDAASSAVTQHAGVLAGDGTTGPVDADGGVLSGGGDVGRLTVAGDLVLHPGAQLSAQLLGPTPAVQYDQVRVNGVVDLGGAALFVNIGSVSVGQQFVIVDDDATDPVVSTLRAALDNQAVPLVVQQLPEGATFVVDGTTLSITYVGGTGNDVVLTVVALPSPTTTVPVTTAPVTTTPVTTAPVTTPPATATPTTTRAIPLPVVLPRTGARGSVLRAAGLALGLGVSAAGLSRRRRLRVR